MTVYCDLHLHSCLSPCGDEDMTPNNIVRMAKLKGLHCIALTDHNTCGNCRSTAEAARRIGLGFLPGMELTTAEDIHIILLFSDCSHAEACSQEVYSLLPPIQNKPEIFGRQLYLDAQDNIIGEEPRLLLPATSLSLRQAQVLAARYHAICYPAHIDKTANGILSILGAIPPECCFDYLELSPRTKPPYPPAMAEALQSRQSIISSDAHYLWDISEAEHPFSLRRNDMLSTYILHAMRHC